MLRYLPDELRLRIAAVQRTVERQARLGRAVAEATLVRRSRHVRHDNLWLFGGSAGRKFADNSAALFRYVRQHHPEIDARWVISRESPDVQAAQAHGPVLFVEDTDTDVYGLLARVHVISHGAHDVPGCASRLSRALKVRLGHGLTALKRKAPHRFRFRSLNSIFDIVPVSSEFEAAHKREWGIEPEKIRVTGIARFDELLELARSSSPKAAPRRILYMPTVREWLAGSAGQLEASAFYDSVRRFLVECNRVMARHDVRMSLFVHPGMWDQFASMQKLADLASVDVLPLNADLQRALVECSLFITDYSSVAWDALYIDRPTMFFHFDLNEQLSYRGRGAHLDLQRDLFGPTVRTIEDAVESVAAMIERDFAPLDYEQAMARWRDRAFFRVDTDNRRRIFEQILLELGRR